MTAYLFGMKLKEWIATIGSVGIQAGDSGEEKIRKSSLTVLSFPFALAGLIWGCLYFYNGLILSGAIPFTYGILSLLTFAHFAITKRYRFFRKSQLVLILVLPFFLQLSLGGFIPSSAVIIWALLSPTGALVFFNSKKSLPWFFAYLILLVVAWLLNDRLGAFVEIQTSTAFINAIFLLNLAAVSSLIFAVQYFYVNRQDELKKTIENRNEKLNELDKLKTQFFANISHEFRTPLTIILGLANKQVEKTKNEQVKKDNETIKNNANRLLELVNQLLDISKLESGEARLQLREDDLVTYLKRNYAVFESLAVTKNQLLLFNGKKLSETAVDAPIRVFFDHEKMQKVISNLLSNAVKFTPQEGIIDVTLKNQENKLQLEVSNTGIEIELVALPHLFDRFYQVNAESTREHEGTGIGLALVKELVEVHQGSISVISEQGKTTFSIELPLAYDHEFVVTSKGSTESPLLKSDFITSLKTREPEAETTQHQDDKLLVLVVEDNPDLRHLVKSILKDDFNTIEAVDGMEGLSMANEHIPDLIISDVMMPKMDGLQLCKEIKNQQKTGHIPVVLLTAKASAENKIEGLEKGADDYLVKPFDKGELLVRVMNLIQIRKNLQLRYIDSLWSKKTAEKKHNVNDEFLLHIKECIDSNLDNNLYSVEDLAQEIGMSRSQVHRKLKALTNKSATNYVKDYRLHRGAELLLSTDHTVSEIAYDVGFSSQTYFSKSFHELFGQSPTEYKVQNAHP